WIEAKSDPSASLGHMLAPDAPSQRRIKAALDLHLCDLDMIQFLTNSIIVHETRTWAGHALAPKVNYHAAVMVDYSFPEALFQRVPLASRPNQAPRIARGKLRLNQDLRQEVSRLVDTDLLPQTPRLSGDSELVDQVMS